jgi:hypothetical protein
VVACGLHDVHEYDYPHSSLDTGGGPTLKKEFTAKIQELLAQKGSVAVADATSATRPVAR